MIDDIDKLLGPDWGTGGLPRPRYRYTPEEIGMLNAECDKLRELLKHADTIVVWENTLARSGFQEEIEAALGIGGKSVTESEP